MLYYIGYLIEFENYNHPLIYEKLRKSFRMFFNWEKI